MPGKISALYRKNFKGKLIFLALALVFALYFTNDFGLVDVEKTAVIAAVGVDRTESGLEVSCQLARPADVPGGPPSQVVVTGSGGTPAECFAAIQSRTGWHPKLSFCMLLVLGRSVLEAGAMDALQYFMRTQQFNDSALLAGCDGSAKDFLEKTTPLDPISGFGVQKILSKENRRVTDVASVSLKDFAVRFYSASPGTILPLLAATELTVSSPPGSAAEGQEGETAQNVVYEATESAVLSGDTLKGTLSARETRAYNLVMTGYTKGNYSVTDERGKAVELEIDSKRVKKSADLKAGHIVFGIDVKLRAHLLDTATDSVSAEDLANSRVLSPEVKRRAESAVREDLTSLFAKSAAAGADYLDVGERLHKYRTRAWKEYLSGLLPEESPLKNAEIAITVTVED